MSRDTVPILVQKVGGLRGDWETLIALALFLGVASFPKIYARLRGYVPETVTLRRTASLPTAINSNTQIWKEKTLWGRVLWTILLLCLGMVLLIALVRHPVNEGRSLLALIALFCFVGLARRARTTFHPLLGLEQNGLQIGLRKILWSQIDRVHIKNDLLSNEQTHWQFFNAQGQRLARVALPATSHHQQKIIISELAEVLNAHIVENPLRPSGEHIPDSSYLPMERPY